MRIITDGHEAFLIPDEMTNHECLDTIANTYTKSTEELFCVEGVSDTAIDIEHLDTGGSIVWEIIELLPFNTFKID